MHVLDKKCLGINIKPSTQPNSFWVLINIRPFHILLFWLIGAYRPMFSLHVYEFQAPSAPFASLVRKIPSCSTPRRVSHSLALASFAGRLMFNHLELSTFSWQCSRYFEALDSQPRIAARDRERWVQKVRERGRERKRKNLVCTWSNNGASTGLCVYWRF